MQVATFLFLFAACSNAQLIRKQVKTSAEAQLANLSEKVEKIEKGELFCGFGVRSSYFSTIIDVTNRGLDNGLRRGDEIMEVNGEEVTRENYLGLLHDNQPGDEVPIVVFRDDREIAVTATCIDETARNKLAIRMLKSAALGEWQKCIDLSYDIDELNNGPIQFTAMNRLNCNEAKRCGFLSCAPATEVGAQLLYEVTLLQINDLMFSGDEATVRASVQSGAKQLRESGFPILAADLETELSQAGAR